MPVMLVGLMLMLLGEFTTPPQRTASGTFSPIIFEGVSKTSLPAVCVTTPVRPELALGGGSVTSDSESMQVGFWEN